MSIHTAEDQHQVAYQDLVALVNKHAGHLSAIEMLAIASNMLGKLVAMQDQRTITGAMAMEVVAKNLELGNKQILDMVAGTKGNA